jgi:hypothetical protein
MHVDTLPLQITVLLAWSSLCALYTVRAATSFGAIELDVLWRYWQPVLAPLLMLWLWARAVRTFTQLGIPYEHCFQQQDRRYLIDASDLEMVSS